MRLLFLVLCLSTAVNAVVALHLYRTKLRNGPLWWAVGTSLVFTGLAMVFFREAVGAAFSTFLSNSFILAGYAVVWEGMRRFVGKESSRMAAAMAVLVVGLCGFGNYWYALEVYSFAMRIIITSLGILFFSLSISTTLLSAKLDSRAVLFLGSVYSANVFVNGVRVLAPAVSPSLISLVESSTVSIVYLVFTAVFSICVTVGQVWVVREECSSAQ